MRLPSNKSPDGKLQRGALPLALAQSTLEPPASPSHVAVLARLDMLQRLHVITVPEHDAACHHPRLAEVAPAPTEQAVFAWLLRCALVDADDLLAATCRPGDQADYDEFEALGQSIFQAIRPMNQENVDTLLAMALIDGPAHHALSAAIQWPTSLLTPAGAMELALREQIVTAASFDALRAQPPSQPGASTILDATVLLIAQTAADARRRSFSRWRNAFWYWIMPCLLYFALAWFWAGQMDADMNLVGHYAR